MPLRPPIPCTSSRFRARAAVALCVAAILLPGLLAGGCRRSADKPDPTPRYRNLGPKTDLAPYFSGAILEMVDVLGIDPVVVSGYGVVVNLENTGRDDGIPAAVREHVLRAAVVFGVGSELTGGNMGELSATQLLGDPRAAIVRVDAFIPPGARAGQRVDVRVSALESNTTTSLARGELWRTELHSGNITPQNPGERVNLVGQARGRLSVNPVYALEDPMEVKADASAQASLRTGYIQDGGIFNEDRLIILRLREPSWRVSRAIEQRINLHFGRPVAAAQDEGVVNLAIPDTFKGDWGRFVGIVSTLYFYGVNKEYALERCDELVKAAVDPSLDPVFLEGISYAWEGLGPTVVPKLMPLLSDPNPAIAFWAARAVAFNGEQVGVDTLLRIAGEDENRYAVAAAENLGKLKPNSMMVRSVRRLLDESNPEVRVAAYLSLLELGDQTIVGSESDQAGSIISTPIGDKTYGKQFYLDQVPSKGPPIIWASRSGTPRIAVIGNDPGLKTPMLATAFGSRLSVSVPGPQKPASIYYRPANDYNSSIEIRPSTLELIAALGGETLPSNVPIRLCYGDVLAVLKNLSDSGMIVSGGNPVPLILQDFTDGLVEEAPSIPGLENLQAGEVRPLPAAPAGGGASGTTPGAVTAPAPGGGN